MGGMATFSIANKSLTGLILTGSLLCSTISMSQSAIGADRYLWNLTRIGVTESFHSQLRRRGTRVKIGVLDGLAFCSHKEIKNRCTAYSNTSGVYQSFDNHATHVATTIAANNTGSTGFVGVAPKARILSYAIFDDFGWVGGEEIAIDSARKKGARVINMSYVAAVPGKVFSSDLLSVMASAKNKIK